MVESFLVTHNLLNSTDPSYKSLYQELVYIMANKLDGGLKEERFDEVFGVNVKLQGMFLPMFNLFVIVDCVTPSLASQVLQKTCWFFRAQVFSGKFYLFESPIILAPRTFYCLKPVKSK